MVDEPLFKAKTGRMARLWSSTLLLGVIAGSLAASACRRGPEGMVPVVVIGDQRPSLGDPLQPPRTQADAVLRNAIAQGLVRFDSDGQVEPGLAERWNVSDDGLSYIFRLVNDAWPDGRKIMARDVARILTRQLKADKDLTRDALGAVDEVVAMTDRVIEIRLRAPRPNLLTLLAQPEFALIREGAGSGPFSLRDDKEAKERKDRSTLLLRRRLPGVDGEESDREDVALSAMPATKAIAAFHDGTATIVLGGTVADLPLALAARLPRGSLRFDPVAGLFGLAPTRTDGPAGDVELRRLLSRAIDRQALIARLAVPGLAPRATLLQGGLAGLAVPPQPAWLTQPMTERRAALIAAARDIRGTDADQEPTRIGVDLPDGPGGDIILMQLNSDWGPLGFAVERAAGQKADFRWVDSVAPSDSPAWFLRQFRCSVATICDPEADQLLASARQAPIAVQRAGLFAEAARLMDEARLFLPVAAPIRWSLAARGTPAFTENRYARHPLVGLSGRASPGANQ